MFDHFIAYDDGSTDNTVSICRNNFDRVIRSGRNEFKLERSHKELLLEHAKDYCPDFIVSLDADEKLIVQKDYLYDFLENLPVHIDALEIPVVNLWRSESFSRIDSLFGDLSQIKIWRYKNEPPFASRQEKLHQEQFPQYVKTWTDQHQIKIVHTGFSSEEKIIEKFVRYRSHGQSKFELLRLIDESNIRLEKLSSSHDQLNPLTILDYFILMNQMKFNTKKITIFSLVYQDIGWLNFVYKNVLSTTFHLDVEFYFVANKPTNEVRNFLSAQYIPHYIFDDVDFFQGEHYINGVYRAWNFGVSKAVGDIVLLINSDMAFAENWVENLLEFLDNKTCIVSRLIEQGKLKTGKYGIEKNFGDHPGNFKKFEFDNYARGLSSAETKSGGLFMPLMIRKEHFLKVAGYPPGNIVPGSNVWNPEIAGPKDPCVSGDVVLMQKLKEIGVEHKTSFSSISYHFQEGEMRTKTNEGFSPFSVCVCNDSIKGRMGEKVLWECLAELDSVYALDNTETGGQSSWFFNKWWKDRGSYPDLIIQNASFMPKVSNEIFTIAFLQDDLRGMSSSNFLQEKVLATSELLVANSLVTAASYPEYSFRIIPVGVDDLLFSPKDKFSMRRKHNFDVKKKIAIFVGALNEVKGWKEVFDLINQYKDIHWIVVTKDQNRIELDNVSLFSKIDQHLLSEYYSCADFFVLGSRIETQCLAAIECCLCDIPVVMKKTGIFAQMTAEDLSRVGVIGDNLNSGVQLVIDNLNSYSPRETIKKYRVTIGECLDDWKVLIQDARYIRDRTKKGVANTSRQGSNLIFLVEFFYRKHILRSLIGRDSFYSVPEISVFLKKIMPIWLHAVLRKLWRKLKKH